MKSYSLWLAVAFSVWAGTSPAQDTNALKTQLGVFETQTDVVLIKAIGHVGEMSVGECEIGVRCKETTDVSTGHKFDGLVVELTGGGWPRDRILIDEDELDPLINAITFLSKVNNSVTSLPSFDAIFTSKAGLRIIADSVRKDGNVLIYVQYGERPRLLLTSSQVTQFYDLIEQGRKIIVSLQTPK